MIGFSSWYPLSDEGLKEHGPREAAAIQIRRQEGLVDYPSGKSAMVWYGYSDDDAVAMLREVFGDELTEAGARGFGPLQFRYMTGDKGGRQSLEKVARKFVGRFGRAPILNRWDRE